ncbi:CLUMA_CG004214, isoform A [Clunio marinus]|uniref:CLUMA_CG004214, isoform A n=1 Tax=Clunio marinus TaxID=568069 RepID=A0A1J1HRB0_9DIPT|nr:CLUMA_CG004214, isoform A [Clunio marinus]
MLCNSTRNNIENGINVTGSGKCAFNLADFLLSYDKYRQLSFIMIYGSFLVEIKVENVYTCLCFHSLDYFVLFDGFHIIQAKKDVLTDK